jgi:16S rRNA (adenine1518-N6/adenine1519-N6)-dimethyltransferase
MYTLKKALGQHFLHDKNIIDKIVAAVTACNHQQLLEVGPGGGAITQHLKNLQNCNFKACELDAEKVTYLTTTYPDLAAKILHANFLDIEPPFEGSFCVAGNFPYNISSQILFKIVDWYTQVPECVGMFQKEVAQRIAAVPSTKAYGVLSVLIQAYYNVEYLFDVAPTCFTPPPKVISGVIKLTRRQVGLTVKSDRAFKNLVKTAFNQRRKTLRNAVKSLFLPDTLQDPIFNLRAEALTLEDFAALTFRMQ